MEVVKAKKVKGKKEKKKKEKQDSIIDKLSIKDKAFFLAYIELHNGTKAYLRVFPNATYNTARNEGSKYLAKPCIQQAIREYQKKIWEDKEKHIYDMFDKLVRITNSDISDFLDENGNVKVGEFDELDTWLISQYDQNIRETQHGVDVKRSIKLVDKRGAINDIAKILGMIQEKVEHSGTIEVVPAERPEEDKE